MTPIPFIGEREELDLDIIDDEEINSMKDSNGMIQFMNIMPQVFARVVKVFTAVLLKKKIAS